MMAEYIENDDRFIDRAKNIPDGQEHNFFKQIFRNAMFNSETGYEVGATRHETDIDFMVTVCQLYKEGKLNDQQCGTFVRHFILSGTQRVTEQVEKVVESVVQSEHMKNRFFRQRTKGLSQETKTCAICIDELEIDPTATTFPDLTLTVCGHNYHKNCWLQYVASKAGDTLTCPECKTVLKDTVEGGSNDESEAI